LTVGCEALEELLGHTDGARRDPELLDE